MIDNSSKCLQYQDVYIRATICQLNNRARKKIVSLAEWRNIANSSKAFQKGIEYQNIKEALQYFPDDYSKWPLFPLRIQEELKEEANKWYLQCIELIQYRKNPNYGKTKCVRCLLSTDREEAAIFSRNQQSCSKSSVVSFNLSMPNTKIDLNVHTIIIIKKKKRKKQNQLMLTNYFNYRKLRFQQNQSLLQQKRIHPKFK